MKLISIYSKNYIYTTCILCTFLNNCSFAKGTFFDSSLIQSHINLIERCDSLDLEKQKNKRNGISISDLEFQQQMIRDSLKLLQEVIQNPTLNTKSDSFLTQFAIIKPQTIFDWIILIVGCIAVISGVFLIYGIFSMLSTKQKRKVNKEVKIQKPKSTPPLKTGQTQSIAELQALAEKVSDPILNLRKQIQMSESQVETAPSFPENRIAEITENQVNTDSLEKQSDTEIDKVVINAAKNGMNLHDISKTFHISEDHVSLILKIAGNQRIRKK